MRPVHLEDLSPDNPQVNAATARQVGGASHPKSFRFEGMSDEETMRELLDRVAQQQRELDESWERVQGEWNEKGGD